MTVKSLSVEYRGIDYRISRDSEGLFVATVEFPDHPEVSAHKSKAAAVASTENLIDDYRDERRLAREQDLCDRDLDQHNPAEYSDGYDFAGHDFDSDPDWR